jgi:choline dehydrogenase-like flavoprotein
MNVDEYDYIVAGGGTAGCVISARAAEQVTSPANGPA